VGTRDVDVEVYPSCQMEVPNSQFFSAAVIVRSASKVFWGNAMTNLTFPRRQFLHLAAGAAAVPVVSRIATAQLSDAAGAHCLGVSSGRGLGHRRSPYGAMAIGAPGSAIRD
jgi:hypothetical protein